MNPKRRKVDNSSVSPALPSASVASGVADPLLTSLSSAAADPKAVMKSLHYLKEKLANRKEVLNFLETSRPVFRAMVGLLQRSSSEVLIGSGNPAYRERVLQAVLSLLANLCHFSLAACVELNSTNANGLTQLFLRLLESGHQTENTTKANLLRLLGNLCTWKQSFNLTSNANLLDRIASTIIHEDPALSEKALRIVRYLSKRGCNSKALILSNSCYFIGTKLVSCPEAIKDRDDILHILLNLMRFCPRDVGRQLASSNNCASLLFNQLLVEDGLSEEWKRFLLKLTHHSFEIRESFGGAAIESVLAKARLSSIHCEFLCSFAQDAWSRVILRESGALARILDVLDSGGEQEANLLQSQAKIIASLKHFIYDTQTMVYLCQRDSFIRVVLNHIRLHLAANTVKCFIPDCRMVDEEVDNHDNHQGLDEQQAEQRQQNTEQSEAVPADGEKGEDQEKLHKDFLGELQHGAVSPNQHYHNLWSPSMSPNALTSTAASSPGLAEDSRASSSGSFLDDYGFLDEFSSAFSPSDSTRSTQQEDNALYSDDGGGDEDCKGEQQQQQEVESAAAAVPSKVESSSNAAAAKEFSPHQQKMVAKDCLEIITKLTHQEENYAFLVKQDLLCTLLDVISDAPSLDLQIARSIKRLARSKSSLQTLLHMNFHQMVILKLIRRDCILARFSKPCSRCQSRLKFGQEILQEFADHADSNLGWYLLQQDLRSEEPDTRVNAMMTSLVIVRQPERQNRLFQQFMPVETLLSSLTHTLQQQEHGEALTPDQTSMCSHILMSLSSLLTHRLLASLLPNLQQPGTPPIRSSVATTCRLAGLRAEDPANLQFHTVHSECVVPKEELCEASAYFRGMFQNDFVEKTHNRQKFTLDEQEAAHCSEADFQKFLHYLLGCRESSCVQPINGSTVCAMLYLGDKYLCTQFMDELLQPGGLAEQRLDGDSLKHFLVPVLSIPSLGERLNNLCAFTLLRYTNIQQIRSTLSQFIENEAAIAALIDLLQNFILQFTASVSDNRPPQNNLVRLWDYL